MSTNGQSERWRTPLLFVLVGLIAAYLLANRLHPHESSPQQGWVMRFNPRQWKIGHSEIRQVYKTTGTVEVLCNRAYWVGPFFLYRSVVLNPSVLGTNVIRPGMVLYDPATGNELGRVLSVERSHEFPDGTIREGALVQAANRAESWVPRENMRKALVGM